jgi:[ribosomal protein S5]-alanine N-acetyltransferase
MYLPVNAERVRLRPFTTADRGGMHAIYADERVMRWVGHGPVSSRRQSDAMLAGYGAHQQVHGYSVWALVDRAGDALLGDAGLYVSGDEVELVYTLAHTAWGRGYATEAGRLCLTLAFGPLAMTTVTAVVRPENRASARVLTKLGFMPAGCRSHYGHAHDVYRLRAPVPRAGE